MIRCHYIPHTPQVGTRLWRGVDKHGVIKPYQLSDGAIRATLYHPNIIPGKWAATSGSSGLVVFVIGEIPAQWTYLQVMSVQPTSVEAIAVAGDPIELIRQYGWGFHPSIPTEEQRNQCWADRSNPCL